MKKNIKSKLTEKPLFIEGLNSYYLVLIISVITFITFNSGIKNSYTNFDDTIIVFGNLLVTKLSLTNLFNAFLTFTNGMYHPVTTIFLALEYNVFGASAKGFHAVSLCIHIVNSLLVFWLIYLIKPVKTIAIIVALLFALHPMHSESVYWISEQKGLLSALFLISGMISYIYFIRAGKNKYYYFTMLFFVLSVFSKPSGIVFPAILIVIDYYFSRKIVFVNKIPFLIISLIIAFISISAARSVEGINSFEAYSLFDRLVLILYAPFLYIFKAIIPLALSAKYFFPDKAGSLLPAAYLFGAALFLAVIFLVYKFRKLSTEVNFGILFFLVSVSVYLPLISVGDSIISERHSYIPYIGLFFIFAYFIYSATVKYKKLKFAFFVLFILVLGITGYFSNQRSKVWANSVTLWSDVVKKNPEAPLAYVNLGDSYAELLNYNLAEANYTKAISLNSEYAHAYMNRGYVRLKAEEYENALVDMNKAIELNPGFSKVFYNRSCLYLETSQWQKAKDDCDKAIALNPDFGLSYYNRALAYFNLNYYKQALFDIDKSISLQNESALLLISKGQIQIALTDTLSAQKAFNRAEELSPDNAENLYQIAMIYFKSKHFLTAEKYFSRTITISPSFAKSYFYRAMSRESLAMTDEALADYNFCIRDDSTFAPAYYGKGMLLFRKGDKTSACSAFETARKFGFEAAGEMIEKYCK